MDIAWEEIALQLVGLAHLATASTDGRPNVAVVSILVEGRVLWLGTNKLSQKAKNLASNPRVSIMWQPGAEIYVQGTADLTNDMSEKRRLWEGNLFPYDPAMFFGSVDNPDFLLVRIEPRTAAVQSMGEHGPTTRRWKA